MNVEQEFRDVRFKLRVHAHDMAKAARRRIDREWPPYPEIVAERSREAMARAATNMVAWGAAMRQMNDALVKAAEQIAEGWNSVGRG